MANPMYQHFSWDAHRRFLGKYLTWNFFCVSFISVRTRFFFRPFRLVPGHYDDGARGVAERHGDAAGETRLLPVGRVRHGTLGRAGPAHLHRRPLRRRHPRSVGCGQLVRLSHRSHVLSKFPHLKKTLTSLFSFNQQRTAAVPLLRHQGQRLGDGLRSRRLRRRPDSSRSQSMSPFDLELINVVFVDAQSIYPATTRKGHNSLN